MLLKARTAKPNPTRDTFEYGRSIRANVYGLWKGDFQLWEFLDAMELSIDHYFRRAYSAGLANCGMSIDDLDSYEQDELRTLVNDEISWSLRYAMDIQNASKNLKGKFTPLAKRVAEWQNKYLFVYNHAMLRGCQDQPLEWRLGYTHEHCSDCSALNGKVYPASVWDKYGLEPQSRSLECRGYRCACTLSPTSKPLTPGVPPLLLGWKESCEHSHHLEGVR